MNDQTSKQSYTPGFYGKKRMNSAEWADVYIKKWHQDQGIQQSEKQGPMAFPSVCIARQIGVGVLEIADLLAKITHYRVVDREILTHMASDTGLSEAVIGVFDERYPGWSSEFFTMLTSQKTFLKSDYARQLVKSVTALADLGPTIFVGRGAHLILPRQSTLSVSIMSSRRYRVDRLSRILDLPPSRVSKELDVMDAEQQDFFKQVYKSPPTLEFDLVINRDHLKGAGQIARILHCAMTEKFPPLPTREKSSR